MKKLLGLVLITVVSFAALVPNVQLNANGMRSCTTVMSQRFSTVKCHTMDSTGGNYYGDVPYVSSTSSGWHTYRGNVRYVGH